MRKINATNLSKIGGGYIPALYFIEAVGVGVGVYSIVPTIFGPEAYNDAGNKIGKAIFGISHPNAGGQTKYTAEDLGLSYIAPMPDMN